MLKTPVGIVGLCLIFLVCRSVNSAETKEYRLFSEYGIGLRGGTFVLERNYGGELSALAAHGLQLNGEVFGTRSHQIAMQLGYSKPIGGFEDGSEQIRVRTSYHLAEAALAYTGRVIYMLFDVRLGYSMAIATTDFRSYNLGAPISAEPGTDPLTTGFNFPDKNVAESEKNTGISSGLLLGTGIGVDVGKFVDDRSQMLTFRIGADYVRRGARNEILFTYTVTFWPTALRR